MKPLTKWTSFLLAMLVLTALPTVAAADEAEEKREQEIAELRERFRQRYPDLARLRDQQKCGETPTGLTSVPNRDVLTEPIREAKEGENAEDIPTIGQFLAAENTDRKRLYTLLAEKLETTVGVVAKHNARRNFEEAASHHYLRDDDGEWLTKAAWIEKHKDDE